MWNLLPYKLRLLPQRLFYYATTTLVGGTRAYIAEELSKCKHLKVLDIRFPQNWFLGTDHFFGKHLGSVQCYHQLLQKPKEQIIHRIDNPVISISSVFRYQNTSWLASKMSPDMYVGNVVNPAGLAGEKLPWMRHEGIRVVAIIARSSGFLPNHRLITTWSQGCLNIHGDRCMGFRSPSGRTATDRSASWSLTRQYARRSKFKTM